MSIFWVLLLCAAIGAIGYTLIVLGVHMVLAAARVYNQKDR
jgi:hypothetical protein